MKPLVSVIVTSKNEQDVIGKLLESIRMQSYSKIEVVLVDNNSSDKTLTIAKKYTKNIYTYGPERSSQRNFGAKKSRGEYYLFLDSDMHLDPRVISECVENISSKNLGALVIPEVSIGNNFWEKVKSYERSFYKDNLNFNIDSARFIKKSVFLEIGGYDESITGPEDWDLSEEIRKRGYKINKIKSVIYHTERIPNLVNHLKKFFYYGLTSYKSLKKQNQLLSTKTIPLLRRELYGDLGKIIKSPVLFTSMLIMLLLQTTAGGLGYIVGRFKRL